MNGLTRTQTKLLSATVSSDWQIQATGDFNGDGSDDLVFRSSSTGYVTFWTMNGINEPNVSGTSLFPPSGGSDNNWKIQGVGQFNPQTDNYTDILWRNSTGELLVWLMNSDGMSVASQTFLPQSPSADYVTVGVGVITNAYGLPYTDLVFYNPTTNDVWFWSLYQLKPTTTHVTKPGSWTPVGLVDLNRDGLAEIEFMNGNTVSVWSLNNLPNNIPSFSLNMIQSGWTPFHYAR
jgi:hypothetical protein